MKVYTFADLRRVIKEQDYKTGALENLQGERLQGFNNLKSADLTQQLKIIERRLNSELLPNGVYNVLFASTPRMQKNPDKYPILKGTEAEQNTTQQITILHENKNTAEQVLTWAEALNLHKELAHLKEENKTLKEENARLLLELEETEPLSDGENLNIFGNVLKEHAPTLLSIADRYFNLQEKKVTLEEKKLDLQSLHKPKPHVKKPQPIEAGSREHLILIETYFTGENWEKCQREMQKLKDVNEALYNDVAQKLNEQLEEPIF